MSTSMCNVCGEEILKTGKYSIKIHPSKSIPKKAKRILNCRQKLDASLFGLTKFHKYLLRSSRQKNFIEITCGNCNESTTIGMKKTRLIANPSSGANSTCTPSGLSAATQTMNKRKRLKKSVTPKDVNAGLTIPPSLSTPRLPKNKELREESQFNQLKTSCNDNFIGEFSPKGIRKPNLKNIKAIKSHAESNNKKEFSRLKTALFKSKEDSKIPSKTSLFNFLS